MTESNKAVFLSYASQDAQAAARICEALRSAGIEVWFDQSELRGGDAWDQKIHQQIRDCVLFVPVISGNTQARLEGYFRREWKLAVSRTHDMADEKPFLVPVVIDNTNDQDAHVPEAFRAVQWTRLLGGETSAGFCERVKVLMSEETSAGKAPAQATPERTAVVQKMRPKWLAGAVVGMLVAIGVAGLVWRMMEPKASPSPAVPAAATPSAVFAPPPHSIAVLPFVNMSGDKDQEYFSEGLTEEVLNSLARLEQLQVAARTSSFSFQGEHPDIATVAHKLNVGAVLEGSVRRAGHTVRITTQLVNGVTGFHLWSQTYDRDLGDALKLQTEIANAVASALKVTLLGDVTAKVELGGTRNPAAFDAYLRGRKSAQRSAAKDDEDAIAAYTRAIQLDPNFALAFAARSSANTHYAVYAASTNAAVHEFLGNGLVDAQRALVLAPELAQAHLAYAYYYSYVDFAKANGAYERAKALAPGNSDVLSAYGSFVVYMGHIELGLVALRRAAVLDPMNSRSREVLSQALLFSRFYGDAIVAATNAASLDPSNADANGWRGLAYYGLGDFARARGTCEAMPQNWINQWCLAIAYEKLGQHAAAEAILAKMQQAYGNTSAYEYATIYAQWGHTVKALEWLDTETRLHGPGLGYLKTDPLMDPLRKEPRFQAIEKALKFPE